MKVYGLVLTPSTLPDDINDSTLEWITANDGQLVLSDVAQDSVVLNNFVRFCNRADHVCVSWHNGRLDNSCQTNGAHWHTVICLDKDIKTFTEIKNLNMAKVTEGYAFKQQVAKSPGNLMHYIKNEPRHVVLDKVGPMFLIEAEKATSFKAKESKSAQHIEKVIELFTEYDIYDDEDLYRSAQSKGDTEVVKWLEVMFKYKTWRDIISASQKILRNRFLGQTIIDFFETKNLREQDPNWLSLEDSLMLLQMWCKHHGIQHNDFVDDVFNILTMRDAKRKCLIISGISNAGKTYILSSIKPWYKFIGEPVNKKGYTFALQSCVGQNLIYCDELNFQSDTVDIWKKILEGGDTNIPQKYEGDKKFHPTPVIGTCQTPQFELICTCDDTPHLPECLEKAMSTVAMKNRVIEYCVTESWPFLALVKQQLNPHVWKHLYAEYTARLTVKTSRAAFNIHDAIKKQFSVMFPERVVGGNTVVNQGLQRAPDSIRGTEMHTGTLHTPTSSGSTSTMDEERGGRKETSSMATGQPGLSGKGILKSLGGLPLGGSVTIKNTSIKEGKSNLLRALSNATETSTGHCKRIRESGSSEENCTQKKAKGQTDKVSLVDSPSSQAKDQADAIAVAVENDFLTKYNEVVELNREKDRLTKGSKDYCRQCTKLKKACFVHREGF